MKQKIRIVLGASIVILTLAIFIWYIQNHPEIREQLSSTSLSTIVSLIILYGGVLGALMLVLHGTLIFYKKRMSLHENFSLNAYSSLVNFFGPGQSGPGFRAAYLKLKHNVRIKQYMFMTLVYYAFYAFFSGVLLAGAAFSWWITCAILVGIVGVCWVVLKYYLRRNKNIFTQSFHALIKPFSIVAIAACLQVLLLWAVYFIELRSFDATVTLGQAAIYTGAANFALFVALTPGAIGFREAFLVFTQNLHHIPNEIIVAANILDRAVYILFLGVLFMLVLALHTKKNLQVSKVQELMQKK